VQHRHKLTPYVGRRLNGVVERTFVGGIVVFADGRVNSVGRAPCLIPLS